MVGTLFKFFGATLFAVFLYVSLAFAAADVICYVDSQGGDDQRSGLSVKREP